MCTLKQARAEQDKAKREGKLGDVSWWSGYISAIIDWECAPRDYSTPLTYKEGIKSCNTVAREAMDEALMPPEPCGPCEIK